MGIRIATLVTVGIFAWPISAFATPIVYDFSYTFTATANYPPLSLLPTGALAPFVVTGSFTGTSEVTGTDGGNPYTDVLGVSDISLKLNGTSLTGPISFWSGSGGVAAPGNVSTLRTRNDFFFVDCPYALSLCAYSNFFMFRYPQTENVSLYIEGSTPFFSDGLPLSVHDGDSISALGTWTLGPRPAALDPDPTGAPVPEPATLVLLGTGLTAAMLRRRAKRR